MFSKKIRLLQVQEFVAVMPSEVQIFAQKKTVSKKGQISLSNFVIFS